VGWIRGNRGINSPLLAEQILRLTQENAELRIAASKNIVEGITYNGLSYKSLKNLLISVPSNTTKFKNLFELFIELKPSWNDLTDANRALEVDWKTMWHDFEKLHEYKMLIMHFDESRYYTMTPEAHNFYLKAKSVQLDEITDSVLASSKV